MSLQNFLKVLTKVTEHSKNIFWFKVVYKVQSRLQMCKKTKCEYFSLYQKNTF